MPRAPASKARMHRRFVVAVCADAATSGWRRHVYNTSLQPSRSTSSEFAEWHSDTLSANTRISQFAALQMVA